ncbi:hypothetical protein ACFOWA_13215 [Pedobacter lithocola]|uniref:Uncharacterized protein n=1 Tax=Pedobacter lithocola TaxID=1908239 RepID=A0ABV8PAB6_9SPHI
MKENTTKTINDLPENNLLMMLIQDISEGGPFTAYMASKPPIMAVKFKIKKRSITDKILFRKVRIFKVDEVLCSVAELAADYVKMMDGKKDIDLMLNTISVFLINSPHVSGKEIIKLKQFLHWNCDVPEMIVLFDRLIQHAGSFFLSNEYEKIKQKNNLG